MPSSSLKQTPEEHTAPVYFMDLIVENVRCFKDQQFLDLSDGSGKPARWTILLGDNGTGKTTLLKCLTAFEVYDVTKKIEGVAPKDFPGFLLPKAFLTDNGFIPDYEIINDIGGHEVLSYIGKPSYVEVSKFHLGLIDSDKATNLDGFKFINKGFRRNKLSLELQFKNLIIYSYGASRRMGTSSLSESRISDNAASLFFDDVSLINAEEWLLQADFAVKSANDESKSYFENRFDKIKNLLISLLPDADDIRIKPITKEQKKPIIEFKTPYGWVFLKELSLGYQTLIAWMVDLANRLFERYPEAENPLAEPAIVLVDEIDLHLHPKWQRTLIRHLTDIFKQTQFIVTAHSPLIVQSAQDANIVLLRREGEQVLIHNKKEKDIIRGWRLDQVVTSDLFELPSARPAEYDELLEERERILAKPHLSEVDEQRLEDIGKKLEELPVTTNKDDSEAMELIRKAADLLKDTN